MLCVCFILIVITGKNVQTTYIIHYLGCVLYEILWIIVFDYNCFSYLLFFTANIFVWITLLLALSLLLSHNSTVIYH